MAESARLPMLRYLLEMAELEARQVIDKTPKNKR
jgi:hypothetical protein